MTFDAVVHTVRGETIDIKHLKRTCRRFRSAIQDAKDDHRITWLERFPRSCCDHASTLLFLLLFERGFRGFEWITATGVGSDSEKHVWLELSGVVIDITGDQFDEKSVGEVTVKRRSEWHSDQQVLERWSPKDRGESESEYFHRTRAQSPWDEWFPTVMEYFSKDNGQQSCGDEIWLGES